MEGYHIKVGHPKTFYPYGFDNLNVVRPFGPNSRVTFPFRRIEKLRDVPREERKIDGQINMPIKFSRTCLWRSYLVIPRCNSWNP